MIAIDLKERISKASRAEREELYKLLLIKNKRECEKSYYEFFKSAWEELHGETALEDNWHIEYLCGLIQSEVQRIIDKKPKEKDYIVNIAPRSLKSMIFTVMLCPWVWGPFGHPEIKFINNSHNKELSTKHCMDSRTVIQSEWYQMLWGDRFQLTGDQNTKSNFENDHHGMRKATSTGAGIYGAGADILTSDDPQDPEKSESEVERETVKRHWGQTLYSRINDQRIGLRIVIQQRLHEDDLTGYLLENNPEKYNHICIPVELTDQVTPELRKYYESGLFFSSRFSDTVLQVAQLPTNMGATGYACQYLQSPAPPEGGTFKRTWWKFWQPKGENLEPPRFKDEKGIFHEATVVNIPKTFQKIIDSWDTALDGEITRDDVVGQKWGKVGAHKFLLKQYRGKFNFPETKKLVKRLYEENDHTSNVVIEKSANGPAVKADLEHELPGLITIHTGRLSKEDRVKYSDSVPYAAQANAGNCFLPHPSIAAWVYKYIEEHALFPKSTQDGQVDAASQAVNFLTTVKHVWPYYRSMDSRHYGDFQVNWKDRYNFHFGSLYLGKDGRLSLLTAIWNRIDKKLYIYGQLVTSHLVADKLVPQIIKGMKLRNYKCHGLFGNKRMFQDQKRSFADVLNSELSLNKARVAVVEPYLYDRMGAIGITNLMWSNNQATIHSVCKEASRQVGSWYVEKGKEPQEEGFELCECLAMIVSEINRREKIMPKKVPVDGYRPIKVKKKKENALDAWQGM